MLWTIKKWALLLALTIPFGLFAQEFEEVPDPTEMIATYLKTAKSIQSIESKLVQEKHASFLAVPLISEGAFYSQGSERLRWELNGKSPYVLIVNGKEAFTFSDEKWHTHDLAKDRRMAILSQFITAIVSGEMIESDEYTRRYFRSSDVIKIEFVPVQERMRKYIAKLTVLLRRSDQLLEGLIMQDKNGDKTVLKFHDQKINSTLAPELFSPNK